MLGLMMHKEPDFLAPFGPKIGASTEASSLGRNPGSENPPFRHTTRDLISHSIRQLHSPTYEARGLYKRQCVELYNAIVSFMFSVRQPY
jgi:hypothetical protein